MSKALERIVSTIPADFFRGFEESVTASFYEANHLTRQRFAPPEQIPMLGQNRHALCEAGFRQIAGAASMRVQVSETEPKGGAYSWAEKDNIYLLRSNIQTHCGPPRPTKFRKAWAALNKWLAPLQYDLLEKIPEPNPDNLCGMLIVSAFPPRMNRPTEPAFVGLGIPHDDLSSWHEVKSIGEILALYHDKQTRELQPKDLPVEIKDEAQPRLKKRPKSN